MPLARGDVVPAGASFDVLRAARAATATGSVFAV